MRSQRKLNSKGWRTAKGGRSAPRSPIPITAHTSSALHKPGMCCSRHSEGVSVNMLTSSLLKIPLSFIKENAQQHEWLTGLGIPRQDRSLELLFQVPNGLVIVFMAFWWSVKCSVAHYCFPVASEPISGQSVLSHHPHQPLHPHRMSRAPGGTNPCRETRPEGPHKLLGQLLEIPGQSHQKNLSR